MNTVIIGAGPYGLSLAAHLRRKGVPFRIFGRPMDSWTRHMPKGMFLKSEGFASNLDDPDGEFTLARFCGEKGIPYSDTALPVSLATFASYGLAFRERMVPELDERLVTSVEREVQGFRLGLEDGEELSAQRVVLAIGITHFEYVPENLAHIPSQFLSHSFHHHDLQPFRGRTVAVLGAGSSATDLAGLLHEIGADVTLVSRRRDLKFHNKPSGARRPLWQRLRHPQSGLGPGWRSLFFSEAPMAFHHLPESLRLEAVRRVLGPSGGWFAKDKVIGRIPLLLGYTVTNADVQNEKLRLQLAGFDGSTREVLADHVIAATGYKVDLERLCFLSSDIRSHLQNVNSTPVLSSNFESSVPGLYFVGIAAANSFGPLMRFAFGARFAARTVARALASSVVRENQAVAVSRVAAGAK